jgi:uncharacterized protein (DUF1697 family)
MGRFAVFLRGINVGKGNRVGMADLRMLLADEGYQNVATLLQSGNVVLDATGSAAALAGALERAFEDRFGFGVAMVVRTRAQLEKVVAKDPFQGVADNGSRYFVAFLAKKADKALVNLLESTEPGEDQFTVDGTEIYLWCPKGLMESPLMTALTKYKKGPATTVRNWNTVRKLAAMLD